MAVDETDESHTLQTCKKTFGTKLRASAAHRAGQGMAKLAAERDKP